MPEIPIATISSGIPHMQMLLKYLWWENWNNLVGRKGLSQLALNVTFYVNILVWNKPSCIRCILYFQFQWYRFDQHSYQSWNCLVKEHRLYSGTWNYRIRFSSFLYILEKPLIGVCWIRNKIRPTINKIFVCELAIFVFKIKLIDFLNLCFSLSGK